MTISGTYIEPCVVFLRYYTSSVSCVLSIMPQTRSEDRSKSNNDGGSAADTNITMSQGTLASLLNTLQQTQQEFCQQLLREVRSSTPHSNVSEVQASGFAFGANGNFAKCMTRYGGRADESLENFIDAVVTYKDCVAVSDENALRGFSMLLEGPAAVWWQGVKRSTKSWSKALEQIKSAFGDRDPPHRLYIKLFSLTQGEEHTDLFIAKVRALLAKFPKDDLSEKVQLDMAYGLLSQRIRKRVCRENVTSFEELLQKCRNVEDSLKEISPGQASSSSLARSRTQTSTRVSSSSPRNVPAAAESAETATAAVVKEKKQFCTYCKRTGHVKDMCEKLKRNSDNGDSSVDSNIKLKSEIKCYGCGAANVIKSKCKNCSGQQAFYSVDNTSHGGALARSNDCYKAREPAAAVPPPAPLRPASPALPRIGGSRRARPPQASPSSPRRSELTRQRECLYIQGNPVRAAGDSSYCIDHVVNDCDVYEKSCVSLKVNPARAVGDLFSCTINDDENVSRFNNISLSVQVNPTRTVGDLCNYNVDKNVSCVNNTYVSSLDDGYSCNLPFRRPVLIINILGNCGTALVDSAATSCIAGHTLYALLLRLGHPLVPSTQNVRLADGVSREMNVLTTEVKVTLHHKTRVVKFLIFPETNNNESLLGINFLTLFNLVFNFGESKWYFAENSKEKFEIQFEKVSSPVSLCAALEVLRDDEATLLTSEQRQVLANLLVEYEDIFEPGGDATPYAEHIIDTSDNPPIAVPPYRLTPAKKEVMRAELDKMLADDIVEECESAWGSPALLVPKANGKVRFCVDYRKLNAVTKTDVYPMPLIDELVQSTKKHCFMSTLDMRSGFWQVSVREQDRDKTAFLTPFGSFRFKRMPFGLKNAPSTFQRLIDRLRAGASLKDVTLLAYQDDLLLISDGSFEKHVSDLRAVFERLRLFKLRANREKCVFARDKVKYLGHVITQDGVSADEDKVRAVLDMKAPSTLRHLRTFLQTCSWFRKFVPSFSAVAEPLTRLLKKNQPWSWGSDQARAFQELKTRLSSAPILVQADYSKPFVLRTDASSYAIGAVLLQGEGKDERPIEYASRLLIPAERNYSTTEREALAVVWAVERFRGYIEGHEVIIGSDHQPLKWLLTLKSPSGRLVRWALKLQCFNIQFQYTPGKANVIADTLSRPPCKEEDKSQCGICSVVVDLPARSPADLRRAQLDDLELKKIICDLEDTSDADSIGVKRWSERGYFMQQGVLYRYNPDVDSEEPQLVVPVPLRSEILKECHDSDIGGHHGVDRTYSRVAQGFYFPGMRRAITDYIKTCTTCQRYKSSNTKPSGLLQTPVLNQRGEVLAIDLFGPLPKGDNNEKWILLVEDTATRWTELYALKEATSEVCARTLIEEYFLRYGFPRRIVSDNGVQFVSAVMQQCMFILGIGQELLPLYHPSANPAERKNRDLKFQLSRLVDTNHSSWPQHLPAIRFTMNSSVCQTTGSSPAYLMFARELRSPLDVQHDIRSILNKDNFVPQITPYLESFINRLVSVRERVEAQQDRRKECADKSKKPAEVFEIGDQVLLKSHVLSNAAKNISAKFIPKRDGPYVIAKRVSPTAYCIAELDNPENILGKFHVSELTRFHSRGDSPPRPVVPKRHRGRPRKHVCPVC